ncbi:hypothetical protein MKZ91_24140 [Ensifer sp. MJa1]
MTLRSIVFALGALAAMSAKVLAQDSVAYVDDRSDGAAVVRSLYNAINRKEYARAYARTVSVEVKIGKAKTEAGAGSIYSVVPVAVKSVEKNARIRFFPTATSPASSILRCRCRHSRPTRSKLPVCGR